MTRHQSRCKHTRMPLGENDDSCLAICYVDVRPLEKISVCPGPAAVDDTTISRHDVTFRDCDSMDPMASVSACRHKAGETSFRNQDSSYLLQYKMKRQGATGRINQKSEVHNTKTSTELKTQHIASRKGHVLLRRIRGRRASRILSSLSSMVVRYHHRFLGV